MKNKGKQVKKVTYIQILILFFACVTMLTVWPFGQWTKKEVSGMGVTGYAKTQPIESGISVKQEFIPEYSRVNTVSVQLATEKMSKEEVLFHLYSPEGQLLLNVTGETEVTLDGTFVTFPIYMDLNTAGVYVYALDYLGASYAAYYDEKETYIQAGNQRLFYQEEEILHGALVSEYEYSVSLDKKEKIIIGAIILIVALLLCTVTGFVGYLSKGQKKISLNAANILSPIIFYATVFGILKICYGRLFNSNPIDNVVYGSGILLLGMTLFYASRQIKRSEHGVDIRKQITKIPSLLQIVFFAMAIVSCCEFVNAVSNYEQYLATRMMMTYFGLAIISMFEKKEILRIYNYLYLAVTFVGGYFYCRGMEGETFEVGIRTVFVIIVWGIIVMNTAYNLIRKKITRFCVIPAIMLFIFMILAIVYRHTYTWPITAAFIFGLFYLRKIPFEKMNLFLSNFGNGVIFSFVIMTYKALRYRPFHNFLYVRYSGMFHTVTYTTVYYALIFAVVLCKLFMAYKKSPKIKDVWKELILLGAVCGYQFLALSRTGIVASIVTFIVAIAFYLIFESKDKWNVILYKIALPFLAIIWFIPITFTVTRMVPAITNQPHLFVGEWFIESIQPGEPINSRRYITVEQFLGLSKERILGKAETDSKTLVTQLSVTEGELLAAKETTISVSENQPIETPSNTINYDVTKDYTNGRAAIMKAYLGNLNLTGHETISLTLENGESIVHAHNSFIQVAYDSGIISGILFLLLCAVFGVRAIRYYICFYKKQGYAMLPLLVFITFGVSGMVEYVFRPTMPLGFAFFLMLVPLLPKMPKLEIQEKVELVKCDEETTDLE